MKALEYCKKNNENLLRFDEHKYFVNSKLASERYFNVSNHTNPGLKRICFLLDGFKNFTLDGGNSNFVFEDIIMPVALHNCENVTVKNFKFEAMNTQNCQAEIINSGDDWFEMRVTAGCDCFVKDGELYAGERGGETRNFDILSSVTEPQANLFQMRRIISLKNPSSVLNSSKNPTT